MAKKTTEPAIDTALARVGAGGAAGALAIAAVSSYAIVQIAEAGGGDVQTALAENLGGSSLSAFDFQRIRVPAGGGMAWEVMDAETGAVDATTSFEGVIVSWNDQKAFWKRGLDEAGAVQGPPDCFSLDCVQGKGDPGILCASCPNNNFGTAKGGTARGKACKDVRLLFVCRPGDVLPELVPVPPTSLKGVKSYFLRLAARGIPYWKAVTRFKLVKDKNGAGISYAKIDLECAGVIGGADVVPVREYSETIRRMLGKATVQVRPGDLTGAIDDSGAASTQHAHGAGSGPIVDAEHSDTVEDRSAAVL